MSQFRKLISILLACTLSVCLCMSLSACGSANVLELDLNDLIRIDFEGLDGEGTAEYSFMDTTFRMEYGNDIAYKSDNDAKVSAVNHFIEEMNDCGSLAPDHDLSNGDLIRFSWNIDKDALESEYNVSLVYEDFDVTVVNLEYARASVLSLSCDYDGETLGLNTGEDMLFVAEIDANHDLGDTVGLAGNNHFSDPFYYVMHDDGIDGDETAGDNVYSVVVKNEVTVPGIISFYVDIGGNQSADVINITFVDETVDKTVNEDEDGTDDYYVDENGGMWAIAEEELDDVEFPKLTETDNDTVQDEYVYTD